MKIGREGFEQACETALSGASWAYRLPMLLSGTEKIEGKDWYHDGALFILGNQGAEGEWIDTTDTCFALLFLKKAFVAVATGDSK